MQYWFAFKVHNIYIQTRIESNVLLAYGHPELRRRVPNSLTRFASGNYCFELFKRFGVYSFKTCCFQEVIQFRSRRVGKLLVKPAQMVGCRECVGGNFILAYKCPSHRSSGMLRTSLNWNDSPGFERTTRCTNPFVTLSAYNDSESSTSKPNNAGTSTGTMSINTGILRRGEGTSKSISTISSDLTDMSPKRKRFVDCIRVIDYLLRFRKTAFKILWSITDRGANVDTENG